MKYKDYLKKKGIDPKSIKIPQFTEEDRRKLKNIPPLFKNKFVSKKNNR